MDLGIRIASLSLPQHIHECLPMAAQAGLVRSGNVFSDFYLHGSIMDERDAIRIPRMGL